MKLYLKPPLLKSLERTPETMTYLLVVNGKGEFIGAVPKGISLYQSDKSAQKCKSSEKYDQNIEDG